MSSRHRSVLLIMLVLALAGCGEPERPKTAAIVAQPFHGPGDFNEVGKVTFFEGESCASQIMFVFHGAKSVSMAAPFRVSKILTDAARDHKTVRVSGKWRRGKTPGCSYIEATQVELQKSFW